MTTKQQAHKRPKPYQRRKPVPTPPLPGQLLFTLSNLHGLGIQFSKAHLYRLMAQGKFPQTVALSSARVAWRASDIQSWIAERETRKAV